jgi:hypothetical protein
MTNAVSIAQSGANNVTMRNRLINGQMQIDQRNAGASVTPSTTGVNNYSVDRWALQSSQASKLSIQQNAGAVTPPAGFTKYLGFTSLAATSLGAGDYFVLTQPIEGLNVTDFGFGTANATTITLQFWVRSSLTGTFGGGLQNSAANRSYPFSYTISSANTWEQKTITIVGDTSGTWLTTNGVGLYLWLGLGVGTTYSGTAGAWTGANYVSATGAVSVVGTNGATFYITGVQLEKGSTATPFEQRLYGTELQLCQRYLPAWIPSSSAYGAVGSGMCYATSAGFIFVVFQVPPRTPPTGLTGTPSNFRVYNASGGSVSPTALNLTTSSYLGANMQFTGASGLVAGNATIMEATIGGGSVILFTGCEL